MKSYVSLEEKICFICGKQHDSGAILLDRRMEDSMEHKTLTGYDHCEECKKKLDEGYAAFVEVSNSPSEGNIMKNENAIRTGVIAWMKQHVCDEVFNAKITTPMVFVEPDVVKYMQSLIPVEP
jgi:hypothetical protein